MNTSIEKLSELLQSGKITQQEYSLLSRSLSGKRGSGIPLKTWLLNPFQKIAGTKALIIGLVLMFLMSLMAAFGHQYFPSPLSLQIANTELVRGEFWVRLVENFQIVVLFGTISFLTSRILAGPTVRWIDFLGTIALSRYPYACLSLGLFLLSLIFPDIRLFASLDMHNASKTVIGLIAAMALVAVCWQVVVYINAIRESSGLTGKKLTFAVLISLLVSEAIFLGLPRTLKVWSKTAHIEVLKPRDAEVSPQEKFARTWLEMQDAGKYEETWAPTTPYFKEGFSLEKWKVASENVRKPLGPVVQRDLISEESKGNMIALKYRTIFADSDTEQDLETLTIVEEDGKWKVAGYLIRPL